LQKTEEENNDDNNDDAEKFKKIIDETNNEHINFNLNVKNGFFNNRRYNSEEDLLMYNDSLYSDRKTEDQIYNEKIINQLTDEMTKNVTEEITNELLNDILSSEILGEKKVIKKKKELNLNSSITSNSNTPNNQSFRSSSPKNSFVKETTLSACSSSPGRSKPKAANNSNSNNLVNNKYNNFLAISSPTIRDEDSLINNSVFMKTVAEIKKDSKLYFYNKNVLPKFLDVIKKEMANKYYYIIKNLKIPLKVDEEKLMVDLSSQITFKKIYDKNSEFEINKEYLNENINDIIFLDENILTNFNRENEYNENIQHLNKCVFDTVNELIQNKRLYGNLGEPFMWSLRSKEIEFKYKDTKFFKEIFIDTIIKEVNNLADYKIGLISENHEHLNSSQFSKDREKKFNKSINEELKSDPRWENFDEEETIIKLMSTKLIMNQLLNEIVEILEHVQFSRKKPEKYNYKSIFSCENIPLLSFQSELANRMNKKVEKTEEVEEEYEDDDHKSEDKINQ
jgi:hypothetical protein